MERDTPAQAHLQEFEPQCRRILTRNSRYGLITPYSSIHNMASPDFGELKRVQINPEFLSRGSGERITLKDAVVYDFMPIILGSRFMGVDELRRATHFYSSGGSFMMMDEAYGEVAENELKSGNLTPALEAYKRRLRVAVGFVGAMAAIGDRALLNSQEVDRLNLQARFGALENRLIQAVVSQDVAVDLPKYVVWLNNVRRLEKDATQLNRQYFNGTPKYPDNPEIKWIDPDYMDRSMVGDKELGARLRDTYAQMQRYKEAAWISKEIGDTEGQAQYEELAKTDPLENPKYQPILWRIQAEYDRSRGYI